MGLEIEAGKISDYFAELYVAGKLADALEAEDWKDATVGS
jgi:hypothetical protein